MFGPFKLVRKAFKQLKSDMTPTQIAVGLCLGVIMGLTPAGLHWLLPITAALLFNCSFAMFLLSFGVFKGLFLLVAPVAFGAGTTLLSGPDPALGRLVTWLVEAPVLAFMGFDRYLVAGSYVLALPIAFVLFFLVRALVKGYRNNFVKKMADAAWYQKARKRLSFRLGQWLLVGKEKQEFKERKRFILLRPFRAYMAVAIPVLCIAFSVGAGVYAQIAIEDIALGAVNRQLKVQGSFEEIGYSFFSQKLTFRKFQLPDPKDTKQDLVRIGSFEGDLSFADLLAGRFHAETLAVHEIATQVPRDEDGAWHGEELMEPDEDASAEEKKAWEEYLKIATETDWVGMYRKVMFFVEKVAKTREKEEAAGPPPDLGFDPDLRWRVKRTQPLFALYVGEASGFSLELTDLPAITGVAVKFEWISTKPGWNGQAVEISGAGKLAGGRSGEIAFAVSIRGKLEWTFRVDGVPLADLAALYGKSLPVVVEGGKVSLSSEASVADWVVEAVQNLRIDGLKIALRPGEPGLFGLDAETSQYVVMGINAYGEKLPVVIGVAVSGPISSPEIHAKVPFLEIAKQGLVMLGRKELQKYIDRIGGEIDELKKAGLAHVARLKDDFKEAQEGVVEAIKTGDVEKLKETADKAKEDLEKYRDTEKLKEDAKKKAEDAKKDLDDAKKKAEDLMDLLKRKKK
ncbi:MAG: TIGR03546 family protein [Planctomycetota bacterium]|jgi:uncharacterized protein (TIGR03546 family)